MKSYSNNQFILKVEKPDATVENTNNQTNKTNNLQGFARKSKVRIAVRELKN